MKFAMNILGILLIAALICAVFYVMGFKDGQYILNVKCAETQGRYDFCVQKVSWEVKR